MTDVADRAILVSGAKGRRHRRRTRPTTLYLLASAAWVALFGLPVERIVSLLWLFGLMFVAVRDRGADRIRDLVRDWGLFAVLLLAYRYSAGLADGVGRPVLVDQLATVDRWIGFGEIPTVRLQAAFPQTGTASLWQVPLSFVYVSHFFGVLVAAAILWLRDRATWVDYTKRLLTLAAAAVATYVLVPAAPPWMAAEQGVIDEVVRSPFHGWDRIGLDIVAPVVEQGRAVANPVAALPSMHAGFALFLAWYFWGRVGGIGRALLAAYALSMAFTLVLTGEHWVADVLLGWLYVAAVMIGFGRHRMDSASSTPSAAEERRLPDERRAVAVRSD